MTRSKYHGSFCAPEILGTSLTLHPRQDEMHAETLNEARQEGNLVHFCAIQTWLPLHILDNMPLWPFLTPKEWQKNCTNMNATLEAWPAILTYLQLLNTYIRLQMKQPPRLPRLGAEGATGGDARFVQDCRVKIQHARRPKCLDATPPVIFKRI